MTRNQAEFNRDAVDSDGVAFSILATVNLPANSRLKVVLHNGGRSREGILAGPVRAVPVGAGAPVRVQNDSDTE